MPVGVDAQEERGAGAVRDPGTRDVAHAPPRRPRPRHDDRHPGAAEQGAQAYRDVEDEVGLADPRHDATRPTAVLDLAGRRARPDRLGLRVGEPVVSRVDHDDRPAGSVSAGRKHEEGAGKREAGANHCGGIFVRIQA